jgi:hypothetical protein
MDEVRPIAEKDHSFINSFLHGNVEECNSEQLDFHG